MAVPINNFTFRHEDTMTPIISDVMPSAIRSPTVLTITGSRLDSLLDVTVGPYSCPTTSVSDSQVLCEIDYALTGFYDVAVYVDSKCIVITSIIVILIIIIIF